IRRLQREYGRKIHYAGIENKRKFLNLLVEAGGYDQRLLEFCLFDPIGCGRAIGANRNALLLQTAGEIALSVDDDVTSECAPSPDHKEILRLYGGEDPTDFWFYPDRQALERRFTDHELDVLGLHEKMLGKRVDSFIRTHGGMASVELIQIGAPHLRNLQTKKPVILTTQLGLAGDPADVSKQSLFWVIRNWFIRVMHWIRPFHIIPPSDR